MVWKVGQFMFVHVYLNNLYENKMTLLLMLLLLLLMMMMMKYDNSCPNIRKKDKIKTQNGK